MAKHLNFKKTGFLLCLLGLAYITFAVYRPLALKPIYDLKSTKSITPNLDIAWYEFGEQAVGIQGYGVLATYGAQQPVPTASIAKVMAALAVLHQKPLALDQRGPNIPMTASDVNIYQQDEVSGQSVAAVQAGEAISEYQVLEAMLLPSANNMATTITNWAFGSQAAYLNFADNYAKQLGMTQTHFSDASGFSPSTVSTPSDLVLLGEAAMQNPVIKSIVKQSTANIPIAGQIKNVNFDISGGYLDGIKTGSTIQAGGCLLYSIPFNGTEIVGAILGAPDLGAALSDGPKTGMSFESNIELLSPIKLGQIVGHYMLPWGGRVDAIAQKNLSVITPKGTQIPVNLKLNAIKIPSESLQAGSTSITYNKLTKNSAVILNHQIFSPSIWWRLTHP